MPRTHKPVYIRQMEEYLKELEDMDRSPETIITYRSLLTSVHTTAEELNIKPRPRSLTKEQIQDILTHRKETLAISTGQTLSVILKSFLTWAENPEIKKIPMRFQEPPRPNARWLEETEAVRFIEAVKTPTEAMLTHLFLEMWLRSTGARNLKYPESFRNGTIHILSKGRKWRTLPYHPMTRQILEIYLPYRDYMISQEKHPNPETLEYLILNYSTSWGLVPISKSKVWSTIKDIGERIGLEVSPHDLRRTGARITYFYLLSMDPRELAEPPLITVSRMLGHSSTDTTIKYLGIGLADMSRVYNQGPTYRKSAWGTKNPKSYPETAEPAIIKT